MELQESEKIGHITNLDQIIVFSLSIDHELRDLSAAHGNKQVSSVQVSTVD